MYQKDDIVVYGAPGVCRISGIIEKTFGGISGQYYELKPVYDEKSTLFVPVENQELVDKMHRVLSADSIKALIQSVSEEETAWIADEAERKQYYKEILDTGDRRELFRAIKALYLHRQHCQKDGKKMHVCDERFFKEAERILYDEIAFVLQIDRDQILHYIFAAIQ